MRKCKDIAYAYDVKCMIYERAMEVGGEISRCAPRRARRNVCPSGKPPALRRSLTEKKCYMQEAPITAYQLISGV